MLFGLVLMALIGIGGLVAANYYSQKSVGGSGTVSAMGTQ